MKQNTLALNMKREITQLCPVKSLSKNKGGRQYGTIYDMEEKKNGTY
jgi:hypothetical protein